MTTPRYYDRVRETSTTTGTGTFTLLGAVSGGFRAFLSVYNAGDLVYYCIQNPSLGEWEVGLGSVGVGGTTLLRSTVTASSNAGGLVNFSAGTKDVFTVVPAQVASSFAVPDSLLINGDFRFNQRAGIGKPTWTAPLAASGADVYCFDRWKLGAQPNNPDSNKIFLGDFNTAALKSFTANTLVNTTGIANMSTTMVPLGAWLSCPAATNAPTYLSSINYVTSSGTLNTTATATSGAITFTPTGLGPINNGAGNNLITSARFMGLSLQMASGIGPKPILFQWVESERSQAVRGQTCTLQVTAAVNYSTSNWWCAVLSNTSVANQDNSPSKMVSSWGNAPFVAPVFQSGIDVVASVECSANTGFNQNSLTFTVPTGCINLIVAIYSNNQLTPNDTLYLTEVGLRPTAVPYVPWQPRSEKEEFELCRRYHRKSLDVDFPESGVPGAVASSPQVVAASTTDGVWIPFDPPMRTAPVVTTSNPFVANSTGWRTVANSATVAATLRTTLSTAIYILGSAVFTAASAYCIHYIADAEI